MIKYIIAFFIIFNTSTLYSDYLPLEINNIWIYDVDEIITGPNNGHDYGKLYRKIYDSYKSSDTTVFLYLDSMVYINSDSTIKYSTIDRGKIKSINNNIILYYFSSYISDTVSHLMFHVIPDSQNGPNIFCESCTTSDSNCMCPLFCNNNCITKSYSSGSTDKFTFMNNIGIISFNRYFAFGVHTHDFNRKLSNAIINGIEYEVLNNQTIASIKGINITSRYYPHLNLLFKNNIIYLKSDNIINTQNISVLDMKSNIIPYIIKKENDYCVSIVIKPINKSILCFIKYNNHIFKHLNLSN